MALIRRMLQADLPDVLPIDEYVFCTDTAQFYAGTDHGSQQIVVPSAVTWGLITGTLSTQADLQTALNGKLGLHAKADTAGTADSVTTLAAGADRTKLDGIAAGATVGADWNTNVSNKPALGSAAANNTADFDAAGAATAAQAASLPLHGKADSALVADTAVTLVVAATLPTSAALGQMLFTTDTEQFYMGTGSSLVQIGISPAMLEKLDEISQKLTVLLLAMWNAKQSGSNSVLDKQLDQLMKQDNIQ